MLGRREHSAFELRHKLAARGFEAEVVREVLAELTEAGWQSDARFTEAFVRSRAERGKGPLRILAELRERGIDDACAEAAVDLSARNWQAAARALRQRRFGDSAPDDAATRARQSRFLAQRGFTSEQVRHAFRA